MGTTGIEKRLRGKTAKGKPRVRLPTKGSELFAELKAGKSIREIAREHGASPETIRGRLKEHDREAYSLIARQRTSPERNGQRRELPVPDSTLYAQWKNGESIRDLAERYKVSRQTITRRLKEYNEQEYGEIAKNKTANSIAERRKKIPALPEEILDQFRKGESTADLAGKYHVSRWTIARILLNHDKNTYQQLANERMVNASTKESLIPIGELKKRWENGETRESLEKASGLSYRTILGQLKKNFRDEYEGMAQRRALFRRTCATQTPEPSLDKVTREH